MKYVIPIWLVSLTFLTVFLFAEIDIVKNYSKVKTNSATFSPDSDGFQSVDTEIGKLLIIVQKIEKYADGHKLFLQIGNPTSAVIEDIDVNIKYGIALENAETIETGWYESLKQSSKTVNKKFSPGSWSDIQVVLSPSTEEETGFLSVSLDPKSVSLKSK